MENEIVAKVENPEEVATEETELAVAEPQPQAHALSRWNDKQAFSDTYKIAKVLAVADLLPQAYRGKPSNCVIAIDMADRMGISPIAVMQNSQVVSNNFSWKGSACKSLVDGCGKYKSTRYVEVGERGKDSWGYYLEAVDNKTEDVVKGIAVTVGMAKAEGWYDRNPKWKSLTELMLKYRCASFFAKTECPSILMGFQTAEEMQDIGFGNPEDTKVTVELNSKGE